MENVSIKKAALINFFSRYSVILLQIVITGILSRILSPKDFGVVAIIMVFITLFTILADMGIGPAIIQNKSLTKKDEENIFSFTFYMGIFLGIGFIILSLLISKIYMNDEYIYIGYLLSFSVFLNTLNMVPNSLMLKSKRFKSIGLRQIIVALFCGVITIILALLGFKYYALVLNSIISSLLLVIWNISTVKIHFKFKFNKESISKIKSFSSFQFGFNIINYFARNLDNLLVGKFMGDVSLGYYDKAYRVMGYPVQNLTQIITPILHPILSDYQKDKEYIYRTYVKIVKILSLLGIYASFFCYISAEEIIYILFGDKWGMAVPALQFLCFSIWAQIISSCGGAILQSLGKPRLLFINGLINTIITIILIIIGVSRGSISDVALFISIAYNIHFIINCFMLVKVGFEKPVLQFLKIFKLEVFIIGALILSVGIYMPESSSMISSFIMKFAYTFIIFISMLLITKEYKIFSNLLRRK